VTMAKTKAELIADVRAGRTAWRDLVAAVPRERMDEPGPMGDWSFHDMASHLGAWRLRAIERFEAVARGEADPPSPWPAELEDADDDAVNEWIRDRDRTRPLDEILAAYDAMWDRLAAALEALPDATIADPDALPWMDGNAIAESDFLGHLDEHAVSVRAWLEA